jgi:uncharacterized protein (DUF488 family)
MQTLIPSRLQRQQNPTFDQTIVFHSLGYEQSELKDYLWRLQEREVSMVVDVRDIPVSRKRGFSKNQLQEALTAIGINYIHIQTLGAPKEIRDNLRSGGAWRDYIKQYSSRVLAFRREDIQVLIDLASRERISLLCFERDPRTCHRSLVADEMVNRSHDLKLKIEHILY